MKKISKFRTQKNSNSNSISEKSEKIKYYFILYYYIIYFNYL